MKSIETEDWGFDQRHYALFTNSRGQFQWRWLNHKAGEDDAVSQVFNSKYEAMQWANARLSNGVISKATGEWKRVDL